MDELFNEIVCRYRRESEDLRTSLGNQNLERKCSLEVFKSVDFQKGRKKHASLPPQLPKIWQNLFGLRGILFENIKQDLPKLLALQMKNLRFK